MFRIIAWVLLALYLLVVGLWPAAIAPITLTFAGLGAVLAAVPGPVLALAAGIAWLKHRPAPAKAVA
ncbi:hypothetical protein ACFXAS_05620 [Streptomyces sp. NPDC059459]|uniref:hypothetical protein n=1 Tax=Streptomyces sp. NPDC059459 TaxID=3346839 RepID=UPI0036BFE99D